MGGAVATVCDTVTDNRTYYQCPKCGAEKWAYGSFAGTQCWECTAVDPAAGIGDIVCHTADTVTAGLVSTTKDVIDDNRIYYNCRICGDKVWAYGGFVGNICRECMNKGYVDSKRSNGYLASAANGSVEANFFPNGGNPKLICSLGSNDKVYRIRVRSVWLEAPSWVCAIGSIFTGILTNGNTLTHWWVEIETINDDVWYIAQFDGRQSLVLRKFTSRAQVTQAGLNVVGASSYTKNITDKKEFKPSSRYMTDVVRFMNDYDGIYDLIRNNCQTFGDKFYYWI